MKYKIVMVWKNGERWPITSGNSYPPPVKPYYSDAEVQEALESFRSNPDNAHLTFEAEEF